MTTNLHLIPTLLIAAASMAGGAVIRRTARRERPGFLPWMPFWGILCSVPAVFYLCLCIPDREASLRLLRESGFESGLEMLAGASGILPGLLYDMIAERLEKRRNEPFPLKLSPQLLRVLLVVVETLAVALPYRFLFTAPFEGDSSPMLEAMAAPSASQSDASSPADTASPRDASSPQSESPDPAESSPD